MDELKSEIIINAGIRAAERKFASAYVTKKGDVDAGAIFVKINTLDGKAKLFVRSSSYDFEENKYKVSFQDLYPSQIMLVDDIDNRIFKEINIDLDCWVIEIEDKKGYNPFENLNC